MKRVLGSSPRLAPRPADAHKASVGRVLVVGGRRGMAGAPALAGLGALRAGAGLVRVAVPTAIQDVVASFRPEMTTRGLSATESGSLARGAVGEVMAEAEGFDVVVLGPGAGREEETQEALREVPRRVDRPLVLDADGLYAWNRLLDRLRERTAPVVLTPHEGEAARLLDVDVSTVRADREGTVARLATTARAVVVLKGPGTLVGDGTRVFRNRTGGPELATAGTGDVLSGAVAALLAGPGLDAFEAACVAVEAHGRAGTLAAQGRDRGVLASEVADALPRALATRVRRAGTRRRS